MLIAVIIRIGIFAAVFVVFVVAIGNKSWEITFIARISEPNVSSSVLVFFAVSALFLYLLLGALLCSDVFLLSHRSDVFVIIVASGNASCAICI